MKLGYIGMPNGDSQFRTHEHLALADRLNFHLAYFPETSPEYFAAPERKPASTMKIALDAAAFGPLSPSEIEEAVRLVSDKLGAQLSLGIQMSSATSDTKSKTRAQAFETLFSYDPRVEQLIPVSHFPMKPPRPEIIGLPVTGASSEARLAAARGYSPMTPSWLSDKDVARVWPAIVNGATSAVRRAQPSQWQVNRLIIVHDDDATLNEYAYGANSPYRRHFARHAQHGLIDSDVDAHLNRVVIAGSANKVAEEILELREAVGEFGALNIVDPIGTDPNMTKATMLRLAQDVMPMIEKSYVSPLKNLERT
ncbi:MAG: hypothetical protein ABJN34_16795 [Litoreibacter sp.]|uniref:hypothetical protein n=1 Tax=Litoreibacter sp. TaxID=1969459 RepID=UPI0032967ED1